MATEATNAIVTLDQVREYLRIPSTEGDANDFLTNAINRTSDAIERFVRGPVKLTTYTDDIYDGSGTDTLLVVRRPIVALKTPGVADLQYRDSPADSWQNVTDTLTSILIDPRKPWMIRLYDGVFPFGTMNVKLSCTAGYAAIPGAIAEVALEAVAETFAKSRWGDNRLGRTSKSTSFPQGGAATDSFEDLSIKHRQRLSPYVWYMP